MKFLCPEMTNKIFCEESSFSWSSWWNMSEIPFPWRSSCNISWEFLIILDDLMQYHTRFGICLENHSNSRQFINVWGKTVKSVIVLLWLTRYLTRYYFVFGSFYSVSKSDVDSRKLVNSGECSKRNDCLGSSGQSLQNIASL